MFAFKLALALGRTVDELYDTVSAEEFDRWAEYHSIDPFGEWRADVRSGLIASVIANVNRDPTKKPDAYTAQDFMLFEKRKESVDMSEKDGAHIAPETIAWLFGQVSQNVH
jgi:hypothetical protein